MLCLFAVYLRKSFTIYKCDMNILLCFFFCLLLFSVPASPQQCSSCSPAGWLRDSRPPSNAPQPGHPVRIPGTIRSRCATLQTGVRDFHLQLHSCTACCNCCCLGPITNFWRSEVYNSSSTFPQDRLKCENPVFQSQPASQLASYWILMSVRSC